MPTVRDTALINMINEYLATHDVLVSTHNFLTQLKSSIELLEVAETEQEIGDQASYSKLVLEEKSKQQIESSEVVEDISQKILISCDASIKKNPGGPSSVGVIIRYPGEEKPLEISQVTRSTTNNQAEYDAVYTGLINLLNLFNRPRYPVKVYSDSQLIIRQLNGEATSKDPKLTSKKDMILQVVNEIEMGVTFEWRPRNSTPDLKQANYLAQDVLGVKRH